MKKTLNRLFASLLALVLLCAALPIAAMADGIYQPAVVLNPIPEERLNLRTYPSNDAPSLGRYYNGVEVEILSYVDSNWVQVRVGTLTGYMRTKYLSTVLTSEQVDAMPRFISTSSSWPLYSAQSYNSVATTYGQNEVIRLLGFNDEWWHIAVERVEDGYLNITRTGFIPSDNSMQPTSGAYGAGHSTAVVKNPNAKDRLNLRTSPQSDASSLGKYYNGTTVILLEDMIGDWWKVQIGNLVGFMDGYYLDTTADQYRVDDARPTLTISESNTPMYAGQSASSTKLMTLSKGAQVTVLGFTADWCHIMVGNTLGFIRNYNANQPQDTQYARPDPVWQNAGTKHKTAEWPIVYQPENGVPVRTAIVRNSNPADRLNLRTEPKQSADSLGKYYNGVVVKLTGRVSGDFTEVDICGLVGWMRTEYLEFSTDPQHAPKSMMPELVVSNPNPIGNLNLRSGQSTSTPSLGTYANGTKVIVMGFRSNWAHVILENGQTGFMVAGYIQAAD